jgi:hypothetical protein
VGYFQLGVRGQGFTTAAAVTSWLIALALAGCFWRARQLHEGTSSAASLLLLFPGLVATYLARPEHPLVTRLLVGAKIVLGVSAVLIYVAAGQVALASEQHPANLCHLRLLLATELAISALIAVALTITARLPRPYSDKARPSSSQN